MSWVAAGYGTVSDIEVAWVLLNLAGILLSSYNVRGAWLDRQAATRLAPATNGRRRLARTQERVELARFAIQTILLVIGVGAMLLPDAMARDLPTRYVVYGAVFRWGMISVAVLVAYQSWENFALRRYLDQQPVHEGGTA